jgi:hypothetical protein
MTKRFLSLFALFVVFLQTPLYCVEDTPAKPDVEALFSGQTPAASPLQTQTPTPTAKVLYAKYLSHPTEVKSKEKFEVKLEATILLPQETQFSLFTDIPNVPELERMTDEIIWYKKSDGKYETTITFKTKNKEFKFPIIGLSVMDANNVTIDKTLLVLDNINFKNLSTNKEFYTNVTASTISVSNLKIKQYSNSELLCSMEIHGTGSNLGEFRIPKYSNQGRKELIKRGGEEILYYFVIIPIDTPILRFDYFNSNQQTVVTAEIPIILEEDLVSTQTGLNPNEGNFDFYKQIFFAFVATIFFMIYYYRKNKIYLFIAVIASVILINKLIPNGNTTLKKGEKVYILPTSNSTVFRVVGDDEEVEVLLSRDGFKKVLFKNENIGWVKSE